MTKKELLQKCKESNVRFVRLQFTELHGQLKNVQIPIEELNKALDNQMMFDGSSIRGYRRIEQSDMYFHPDPSTFQIIPWLAGSSGNVARIICDVADPDGTPFPGDPRVALKNVIAEAKKLSYEMNVGPEAEFFIFNRDPDGTPRVNPHDRAGYFDVGPMDKGEEVRRAIEDTIVEMGFHVEASHHEVAIGQHGLHMGRDAVQRATALAVRIHHAEPEQIIAAHRGGRQGKPLHLIDVRRHFLRVHHRISRVGGRSGRAL